MLPDCRILTRIPVRTSRIAAPRVRSTISNMDSGIILTAVIGASAATIGVVVTKDSKISEFRQQWIDSLREDVAALCSVSVALYYGNVRYSMQDRMEVRPVDTDSLTQEANRFGYRVRLRLDPIKPPASDLIEAMDRLVHLASHAQEPFDAVNQAVELVLDKTRVVLDDAWRNVRRGEPRFRWTFRFACTALLSSLLWAFVWWLTGNEGLLRAFIGRR